jgi:hypothetical protein
MYHPKQMCYTYYMLFDLPEYDHLSAQQLAALDRIPLDDWAELPDNVISLLLSGELSPEQITETENRYLAEKREKVARRMARQQENFERLVNNIENDLDRSRMRDLRLYRNAFGGGWSDAQLSAALEEAQSRINAEKQRQDAPNVAEQLRRQAVASAWGNSVVHSAAQHIQVATIPASEQGKQMTANLRQMLAARQSRGIISETQEKK